MSAIAHEHKIPLVIDNTLATPYLCTPLAHGADIVVHSATKFIGGHGTSIGGVIVDGGTFDYEGSGGSPGSPSPTRATTDWSSAIFPRPLFPARFVLKARLQYLRDLGPAIVAVQLVPLHPGRRDPEPADGAPRAERRRRGRLAGGPRRGEWVTYPGLASSPWHARQQQYLPRGGGAILAFGIEGGADAGRRFIEGLELFSHLANVGDVRSLAIHPASTTHSQLTEAEQVSTGVTPDLVRLCIGIESVEDILADLEAGLRRRQGGVTDAPTGRRPGSPATSPGGRRFARLDSRRRPASALEGGGTLPGLTVAYETWGTLDPTRSNAVLVLHALTGDSHAAGPAGPGHPHARVVGRADRPGRGHRHRPLVRGLPQRARGVPGNDGPVVAVARRHAVGLAVPTADHPRPGGGRGAARRPPGHRPVGRGRRRFDGRDAGARVVRRAPGPGGPGRGAGRRRGGHRRGDRPVLRCSAAPSGSTPTSTAATTTEPGRPRWPAWRWPAGSDRSATAPRPSSATGSGGGPRTGRTRCRGGRFAVESYLDHQGEKLARRFDPNSYLVLSEAMNSHDVGRGRGGVPAALARVTARVAVAGIDTDRLYPLALQDRVGPVAARGPPVHGDRIRVRPRRIPARGRPGRGGRG